MARKRVPFHYGLFYHAMKDLLGREPDNAVRQGFDGFYEFWYYPQNEDEAKEYYEHAYTLAQWLDNFEILFSGSECRFRKNRVSLSEPEKDTLIVRITIEKEEKKD